MIVTLFITILIEGTIVSGYSLWRRKPLRSLLFTSIIVNLITQSLLWVALNLFLQYYLVTLLIAEFLIWIMESLVLYAIPGNRLGFHEAVFLGLSMNLASFSIGWILPI